MRKFYLFKIKDEYLKYKSYNLYKAIDNIYHLKENDYKYGINYFNHLRAKFNKEILNNNIFNYYKDKYNYTKVNNAHYINDYYTNENTKLTIYNNFLLIETNKPNPLFFELFKKSNNIFVVDFNNRDYFWLNDYK